MEEGVVGEMLRGPLGEVFDHQQLITGVSGSGNNWLEHSVPTHVPSLLPTSPQKIVESLVSFSTWAWHIGTKMLYLYSLKPKLSVPDFVSKLWRKIRFFPKLRDKIQNGKPGFEATKMQHFQLPVQAWCWIVDCPWAPLSRFFYSEPHYVPCTINLIPLTDFLWCHFCLSSNFVNQLIKVFTLVTWQKLQNDNNNNKKQRMYSFFASPVVITIHLGYTYVILSPIQGCRKQDVWYSVPRPNPGHSEKVRRALWLPSILLHYTLNGRGWVTMICMYAYIDTYIHTHMHTYMHIYLNTYIYTYRNIHMCIHRYWLWSGDSNFGNFKRRISWCVQVCLSHSQTILSVLGIGLYRICSKLPSLRFTTAVFPSADDDVITSPYNRSDYIVSIPDCIATIFQ